MDKNKSSTMGALEEEDQSFSFAEEEPTGSNDTGTGNSKPASESGHDGELVRKESQLVNRSKLFVYLVLAIAAAAVSCAARRILIKQDDITMDVQFEAHSSEIFKQARAKAVLMFDDLMDMSRAFTSHAEDTGMTWPNVTLPHFDIRANLHKDSALEFIAFAPFVTPATKAGWEQYTVENQDWIAKDYHYRGWVPDKIHKSNTSAPLIDYELDLFDYEVPLWQFAPAQNNVSMVNLDLASIPVMSHILWDVKVKKVEQYSSLLDLSFLLGENMTNPDHPRGTIYQPVMAEFTENSEVVGFIIGALTWDYFFQNARGEDARAILVEIEGTCNQNFTYKLEGRNIEFLGYGSSERFRRTQFDNHRRSAEFLTPKNARPGYPEVKHTHRTFDASHAESHCTYVMHAYPTLEFHDQYKTHAPAYAVYAIISIFVFTALVFFTYDWLVEHRQEKLALTAARTNAIVSSLFPKDVQKRMLAEAEMKEKEMREQKKRGGTSRNMSAFLNDGIQGGAGDQNHGGAPIADLFPSATIMFADICGFTAWSSAREPSQVFVLLETLYGKFDSLAKKRRVFKVETIGDCYVAVCGLPEKRSNHAVIMCRFARDCVDNMLVCLTSLETSLGPDTCDLGMRVGLHSGPVTAGVLRGERARFQLFGDTVNTTARLETTGMKNRVHISDQCAQLLISHGKQSWLEKRKDEVEAKGKGTLSTWWLVLSADSLTEVTGHSRQSELDLQEHDLDPQKPNLSTSLSEKDKRIIEWHVSMLCTILKQIQAKRRIRREKRANSKQLRAIERTFESKQPGVLDEVQEIIHLPTFNEETYVDFSEEGKGELLDEHVVSELHQFVSELAASYHDNPFHNFEHASHVTMSVCKLLSRIKEPIDKGVDHGYGITSDPLTQFALVLAALIHDADHPGVPNHTLTKEGCSLAALYKNKSIAEQNSFHLTWTKLMGDEFANLRSAIYCNEEELKRFRQLLVNSVMATDIMDKELGAARKDRWNKAFSEEAPLGESPEAVINRKTTIVIEHLIQASDVAHTQQHWHIFSKWNERLFFEMYKAYREGRSDKDPSEFWYRGELGFFDYYVIPLAKKLKECQVFGVSSDEYLTYAEQNRAEWASKGEQRIQAYLQKFKQEFRFDSPSPEDDMSTASSSTNEQDISQGTGTTDVSVTQAQQPNEQSANQLNNHTVLSTPQVRSYPVDTDDYSIRDGFLAHNSIDV